MQEALSPWDRCGHPLHTDVFTDPAAPLSPYFGVFAQVSLCRHDWLHRWLSVMESPASPPSQVGGGAETANPLAMGSGPLVTSSRPEAIWVPTKSCLLSTQSGTVEKGSLWTTEGMPITQQIPRCSMPDTWDKDEVCMFIIP